jgi:hypothetical protein
VCSSSTGRLTTALQLGQDGQQLEGSQEAQLAATLLTTADCVGHIVQQGEESRVMSSWAIQCSCS